MSKIVVYLLIDSMQNSTYSKGTLFDILIKFFVGKVIESFFGYSFLKQRFRRPRPH